MTKREEVAMNSPEREEVARELAAKLGVLIDENAACCSFIYQTGQPIPGPVFDALISREMRVRELEDKKSELEKILAPFRKAVDHTMRAGLNSKGEK